MGHTTLSLTNHLERVSLSRNGEPAIVTVNYDGQFEVISWREFYTEVRRLSDSIRASTDPDVILALPADNDIDGIVKLVAALASERTIMPCDTRSPILEREQLLAQAERSFGAVRYLEDVCIGTTKVQSHVIEPGESNRRGGYILATGGTTGQRKLVHRQGVIEYSSVAVPPLLLRRVGWRIGQTQLLAGPLYHAAPFSRLVDGLLSGNSLVIPRVFRPEVVLETIERWSIEWMQLTPTNMRILDDIIAASPSAMASLNGILHTAAPCPKDTKRNWIEVLGGERVHEMYTATEGLGATICDGLEWMTHPGTVGRGFLTKIRIINDEGEILPPNSVGRVYMRSASSDRYRIFTDSDDQFAIGNGYLSVGDRGFLDSEGFLYLTGRDEDLVIVGGENVYVSEVASVFMSHPAVKDAVAIGIPDSVLGSRICVVAVLDTDVKLDSRALLAYSISRLAPHKIPSQIKFVETIPRASTGKMLYKELTRIALGI